MDAVVDTSVAVPLLVSSHEAHRTVVSLIGKLVLGLPEHALVETYSVLTRLPGDARVAPGNAVELLDANFRAVVAPKRKSIAGIHRFCAAHSIAGGSVYDVLVAMAARDHDVRLLTRDRRAAATYERVGGLWSMVEPG
jgi:toxin FitB